MSNKSVKWGVKFWYLADLVSKYVWNFQVYTSQNKGVSVVVATKGEAQ